MDGRSYPFDNWCLLYVLDLVMCCGLWLLLICCCRISYISITFPARVIVENIIARNVIINRGAAEVDNHISSDSQKYHG